MRTIGIILIVFFSIKIYAQEPSKRPLQIDDFAGWKTLVNTLISNNGKYISFELNPERGDGNLILKHNNKSDTIPRGNHAEFGPENDYLVFQIKQPDDTIRKAKRDKVQKDKMPKDSIGILVFNQYRLVKFPKVKSFQIPEEKGYWVAFTTESEPAKKDTTEKAKNKKAHKQPGDNLVLFEIQSADTIVYPNVTEYNYSKKGDAIYFVQQYKDSVNTRSVLNVFDTRNGSKKVLFASEGWIEMATPGESGSKYAFLFSQDTIKEKVYALYFGTSEISAEKIVDGYTQGIPVGWTPSNNGRIYFSEDGLKLYFGTAESPEPEPKDTLLDEDKPKLDIWNWKDLELQPQQKLEADKENKRTYLAVYHVDLKRFIQLADLNVKQVFTIQKGNGNAGLGYDETPYLRASNWTGKSDRDFYLVDFKSGIKRQMVTEKSYVRLSPDGKYIIWYEPADSSYYSKSTDINDLETHSLTKVIPVNFYDEENDRPMDPSPYGIAGWSEDDRFVYIYDRYDIWKIDPSGVRVPVCVTKAFGRRNSTRLRYIKLDRDLEYIPSNEPILLSAIDERTMSQGFFSARLNTVKDPELLMMDKYWFDGVNKAKEADKIIWTKQSVSEFPNLWSSNLKFDNQEKLSNANPQQKEFNWATAELVKWNSFSGEELKGILYKPENFDPNKKYPMLVYFYERNSEYLYRHQYPYPSHSTINKTFYASNGYLVFVPDITYKVGYPGQSAFNAIVSGTQYLIDKYSFVDKNKIGLQGQSWGGYQTAYLVTQTDIYAAAMAGAPVSNMTSAYGGIRWGTGLSRMFQYEHTQSRIGGTLWEKPLLYIENSPLFYAPKVNTPLLIMHNDEDTAVPWYQGIEFFVALRRLNKPVWMLSYNGELHNLRSSSWADRVDLSKRMFQFFNHYLKGKPAPEWMEKGVPATEKGENLGY